MMNKNIEININGPNPKRFILRLYSNKINIYDIKNINSKEINIVIDRNDYKKVIKLKSIYKIKIIKYMGIEYIKNLIIVNKMLIFVILFSLFILYFLSNIIFTINVIHNNQELNNIILDELSNYGVKVHKIKKNRKEIVKIKDEILSKYKDKLEWLEIESYGTSYIIRYEERLIPDEIELLAPRHLVAAKNAVIISIESDSGVVEKLIGNYVQKGDIIVSGDIKLNESVKKSVVSNGVVYGEVWYTVKVKYPYIYKEKYYSGSVKNNIIYTFLNIKKGFLGTSYTNSKIVDKIRLSSTFLPIYLSYVKEREIKVVDKIFTEDEAVEMALQRSKKEVTSKLKGNEYIITEKILNIAYEENQIILDMFYAICEDITSYQNIVSNN